MQQLTRPGIYQASYALRHISFARRSSTKAKQLLPPHSLLPASVLLRSLLIATILSHGFLLNPALSLLNSLSKPRKAYLNVERIWPLRVGLKNTLYNHFCAGENAQEVRATIQRIKSMGFRGVILTYAREVVVDAARGSKNIEADRQAKPQGAPSRIDHEALDLGIYEWHQGVMETVEMIGEGDFLALKLTGAGAATTTALSTGKPLPAQMKQAILAVCEEAIARRACIFVDAEQQYVQPGIDQVALELMQRYNRGGVATVFNTYQAYLKSAPNTLSNHLKQASRDDFVLGVKLVRGAYISTETRHLINNSKEETDECYDSLAGMLIKGEFRHPVEDAPSVPPRVRLFLATHNRSSTLKAYSIQRARAEAKLNTIQVQYGQLLGMADEVSCTLLLLGAESIKEGQFSAPEVYKCLSWGRFGDCIAYLQRRTVENRDAISRTQTEYNALKMEVWRRFWGLFSFNSMKK